MTQTFERRLPELETLNEGTKVLELLMRHGPYDKTLPRNLHHPTKAEAAISGHLTKDGVGQVQQRTKDIVRGIYGIFAPQNVFFRVSHSPSHYRGISRLGQRARDTAQVATSTISEVIAAQGLPRRHLFNSIWSAYEERVIPFLGFESAPSFADPRLGEAEMHERPEFLSLLSQCFPESSDDWYELFFQDRFAEIRREMKVEGPRTIAQRADSFVDDTINHYYHLFLRREQKYKPGYHDHFMELLRLGEDDLLVDLAVTHGDVGFAYAREVIRYPMEIQEMGYLDAIGIAIDSNGVGSARFGNRDFQVPTDRTSYFRREKLFSDV